MKAHTALAPIEARANLAHEASQGTISPSDRPTASRLIGTHDFCYPESEFKISLFSGCRLPSQASTLVDRAYSRLGYIVGEAPPGIDEGPHQGATLQATHDGATLGTLSVTLDSGSGLRAELLYPDEIARFRRNGGLCEFTRLALDTSLAGREVLCSLFYMAYIFSHAVRSAKHLFVEVNPRHEHFYERMLGFHRLGDERVCPRVGAPAVLLHLDFDFTKEQIRRSRLGLSVADTKLYRYAAPVADEQFLIRRIKAAASD